jgi:hypothetical protein
MCSWYKIEYMSDVEPVIGQELDEIEKLKNNSVTDGRRQNGGARPGAGRKKGGMNYTTKKRLAIRKAFEDRIHKNADMLLNAALNKALGETYLICKVTERDSKGKATRVYHETVTDPRVIVEYLDGELEDGDSISDTDNYYYMSTKPVDMVAVKELYDRAFGKPLQKTDLTTGGDKLGVGLSADQAEQLIKARANRSNI